MRVGVLTGGGDCPGLNAVIRAVARRSFARGHEVIGVREGWRGMVEGLFEPLGPREISGILPRGGTIIGTTRTNPYKSGSVDRVLENLRAGRLDALVAIGGEDTLGVAARLYREEQFPVVGVPKTIDNDLSATDYTFGFDTAVFIATEAIDRLHTTAESHNRVMVVEVMGRHTGWIAVMSGIAGGADVILIPEQPITVEEACAEIRRRHERGLDFSIVVVSEGYELTYASGEKQLVAAEARASDEFGHVRFGGVGEALAREIEAQTGYETRVTVLGHVQRGGSPTPRDRVLATRYGRRPRARGPVRPDGGPSRGRHRRRLPRGGDEGAEDGAARVVRRREGVLRLTLDQDQRVRRGVVVGQHRHVARRHQFFVARPDRVAQIGDTRVAPAERAPAVDEERP
jgi:phosphofructokinase-like protein